MNSETLFSFALGLQPPWEVKEVKFAHVESKRKALHLRIGFAVGVRFADEAGNFCGVYDTVERTWQHLNFFEHTCNLYYAVPRIKTSSGNVVNVAVSWARANSGFTLLFEALVLAMVEREMPVNRVALLIQVNPQRIWTIFNHWVGKALQADDPSDISQVGIDETFTRKGRNYVTVGVDLAVDPPVLWEGQWERIKIAS